MSAEQAEASVPVCPARDCENEVPEDSIWFFRGEFYCSMTCGQVESRREPKVPDSAVAPLYKR